MSDNGIVWEEPGLVDPQAPVWVQRLAPLVEHPGRWANMGVHITSVATRLEAAAAGEHRSYPIALPPGRWEIASRRKDAPPRQRVIFARYLGPEDGE